jgi:spectrin beta
VCSVQENIVSSEDTGNDYEECQILNRKCAEFGQEIQVESQQIEEVITLANKLASVGHSGAENVRDRQQLLSQRWKRLKELTVKRKQNLAAVLQVFSFLKSCDELLDNINEKV